MTTKNKVDAAPAAPPTPDLRRFMIVRTFPPGALDGLDAGVKKVVNENNAANGAKWIYSFANEEKTKTFCVYDGTSEEAVRRAAQANSLPIDYVVEIPVVLLPN